MAARNIRALLSFCLRSTELQRSCARIGQEPEMFRSTVDSTVNPSEVWMVEGRSLRSADDLMSPAVAATLSALDLTPADSAAATLAEWYALVLDGAGELDRAAVLAQLGPKLLTTLEALGATPRARASLGKGGAGRGGRGGSLAAIREARGA